MPTTAKDRLRRRYAFIYYQNGKGKLVASQKLGERCDASGLLAQIKSNQVEQSSQQSYERTMAGIFNKSKVSSPQVSTYLKSLWEDDIRQICEGVAQDSGPAGADLARKWLEREMTKNAMELAEYRQQLRRQGRILGKTGE